MTISFLLRDITRSREAKTERTTREQSSTHVAVRAMICWTGSMIPQCNLQAPWYFSWNSNRPVPPSTESSSRRYRIRCCEADAPLCKTRSALQRLGVPAVRLLVPPQTPPGADPSWYPRRARARLQHRCACASSARQTTVTPSSATCTTVGPANVVILLSQPLPPKPFRKPFMILNWVVEY